MKNRRAITKTARWMRKPDQHPRARRFRDLSKVEDSPNAMRIIGKLGAAAGRKAAAEAQRAGLPLIFVKGNKLISRSPDGKETVLKRSVNHNKPYYIKYKPFTVLHAVKK